MNALITSSIRIDADEISTIGASSSNGFKPTKATQIFVQQSQLEYFTKSFGLQLHQWEANDFSQRLLYPFYQYAQLRQLR